MANVNQKNGSSIEFTVKATEDLRIEGSHASITRVEEGNEYSCVMQYSQRFSTLFRHYAKNHGLSEEDLEFRFVEELLRNDTPESVHLMTKDTIEVSKKRVAVVDTAAIDASFFSQMRVLLDDSEHKDVTFVADATKERIMAHKTILVARSPYFNGLFRNGGLLESETNVIVVADHSPATIRRMLEFIYTTRVEHLAIDRRQKASPVGVAVAPEVHAHHTCTLQAEEVAELLAIADMYLLEELKEICEHAAIALIDISTAPTFFRVAEMFKATILKEACAEFILGEERLAVLAHPTFKDQVESHPGVFTSLLALEGDRRSRSAKPGSRRRSQSR